MRPRDNAATSRSHIASRKFWQAIFASYWQHEAEGSVRSKIMSQIHLPEIALFLA